MPIVKVPNKQKFGIVSLTRVGELLVDHDKQDPKSFKAKPVQHINQAFVSKYNSKPKDARKSMDVEISKALQYAKYKAGIKPPSEPSSPRSNTAGPESSRNGSLLLDVTPYDTSIAWLQLALLCQCNGPSQQEVLQTLCVSLNQAALSPAHVPSLVYIAGLCFQWLKNDMLTENVLRMGEIILLKILYCISLRLYYHHLTGGLLESCTRDEMRQLKFDVEGFERKEKSYRNLPEALLHWRVALEVGLLVSENSSDHVPYSASLDSLNSLHPPPHTSHLPNTSGSPKDGHTIATQEPSDMSLNLSRPEVKAFPIRTASSAGSHGEGSHGDGTISPILWHALDMWQCSKQKKEVLHEAIQDLLTCSTEFTQEKWVEGVLAMNILCTTAQVSLDTLNLVQSLAMGSTTQQQSTCNKTVPQTAPKIKKESKASSKLSDGKTLPAETGTRFLVPNKKMELYSKASESNAPSSPSKMKEVATLNVLGMQPDFNMADCESMYTADQTVFTEKTKEGNLTGGKQATKTASADDVKMLHERYAKHVLGRQGEASEYRTVLNSTTMTSVGTQSLIANESIPDVLPSTEVSKVTMLDLGSITTIDPGESLGKSIGLFTSSNSKNLSISNLVSPGLQGPSGELASIDELGTSASLLTKLPADQTGSESDKPSEEHVPEVSVSNIEDKSISEGAKNIVELNQNMNRVQLFHDDFSSTRRPPEPPSRDQARSTTPHVQPQHVRVVLATPEPISRPASRCTHYTHSTAPLAGGANMLGSQVHPSTVLRHSMFSAGDGSVKINIPPGMAKFEKWPAEVAITYTLCMGFVCIHGRSSLIQKLALEGRKEVGQGERTQRKGVRWVRDRVKSYGLLELSALEIDESSDDKTQGFTSWSIRHAAILGLSRVIKAFRSVPMKDGLSDVSWYKLEERYRSERDPRVIQAFNIAQVTGSDLTEAVASDEPLPFYSPLLANIADGLSELFLPSPSSLHSITKPANKVMTSKIVPIQHKKIDVKGIKSRVKEDMYKSTKGPPIPSFNTRTFHDLNKLAEKGWRRQMLEEERMQEEEHKAIETRSGQIQ